MHLHRNFVFVSILYHLCLVCKNVESGESFDVFPSAKGVKLDETPNFNHLLVDNVRKQVFVGAVNRIYQLMPDLRLKSSFSTKSDNNRYQIQNKLLTIYRDELIYCGTNSRGICLVHDVLDISKRDRSIPIPVEITEEDTYVAVITGNQEKLQQKRRDKSRLDFALVLRRDNQTRFLKGDLTGLNEYNILLIIEKGNDQTKISANIKPPNKYFINYIYGFHFGKFTYFITTLKKTSPDSHYTPILSRVSNATKSSDHLKSEIPIECKLNNDFTYDLVQAAFVNVPSSKLAKLLGMNTITEVLFVVFAQSKHFQEDTSGTLEKASALCMYSVSEIEKKFIQNEKITSEESQNMITNSINSKEMKKIATSAEPVITFDTLITAVTFTAFHDYTVAFVGTHDGHLKEIIFENSVIPFLRSDKLVDEGSPVNSDLFLDWTGDYLYALTKHKLTRIKVCQPNCLDLVSYWNCAAAKNPNYGWCSINNKCNLKQNCSDEHFWTSCESGKCSVIHNVIPSAYSLERSYALQFTIQPIPDFQGQLMCVFRFDDTVLSTNATSSLRSNNNVKCNLPDIRSISTILLGRHDLKAKISINTTKNPEFAEIDYTFYDCGSYTSCTSCVSSFLCNWCISKNKCMYGVETNCKILGSVGNNKSRECEVEPNKDVIMIAANTEKEMEVHATINETEPSNVMCKFYTGEPEVYHQVLGLRIYNNKIICQPLTFNYTKNVPSMTGSLTLFQKTSGTWGIPNNINQIQFIIYKCHQMAHNCTTCSSLNKTYNCGWCKKTYSCEIKAQCSNDSSHWTNNSLSCEEPFVVSFQPETGPRDGKTIIRISVTNLPQFLEIDRYNITVADVPCAPMNKSKNELSCQVKHDSSSQIPAHAGPVVININKQRIQSKRNFSFVQPIIEHRFPNSGPIEGGTTLTLKGRHLNAGNLIEVFIDNLPCKIFANTSHEIKCKTKPSQKPLNGSIIVKLDGKACAFENNSYEYVDIRTEDIQFWPRLGPYEGGTGITILCKNLQKYQGINNITVAKAPCRLHKHSCQPGQEIVCEIERDNSRRTEKGPILFHMGNLTVKSLQNYTFVDPKIDSFSPTQGPRYGATELSFRGQHMNAGRLVKILIDDSPCIIFANNTNEIKCFTSPCITCSESSVSVLFDGNNRVFKNNTYTYSPTTKQDEFAKDEVLSKPRGIPAGGIVILVRGNNLQLAVNPQFCVLNDKQTKRYCTKCNPNGDSSMNCSSPIMEDLNGIFTNTDIMNVSQFDYGIKIRNNRDAKDISFEKLYPKFVLYSGNVSPLFPEWQITNVKDYNPTIDEAYENVSNCLPEFGSSGMIQENTSNNPCYRIITIFSKKNSSNEKHVNKFYGAIAFLILIIVVTFISILMKQKKRIHENSNTAKKLQNRIEKLELNVATECKEAFAELQTEMPNFKSDISLDNIPFLDYRKYVENILLPSTGSYPIVPEETSGNSCEKEKLNLFGDLIMKKTFLLLFIRTLEANENFSMSDRIKVASMIMIALQNKMEYCTDILKVLLAELIEKYVDGKRHPKLLLRRTESVVEKMLSSWFTLLLYGFLKERAGESLYMLFRAIKQHVYKGPVDMITSEAKYSLSQEKLIRQCIDYETLTVYVTRPLHVNADFVEGLPSMIRNIPVKVLDCDTISQVKEKALDIMYRTTGFSQRPKHSEFDIQWVTDTFTRKTLYDDDVDSEIEAGWRKKNTLRHYGVPDGSIFNLVSLEHGSVFTSSTISIDKIGYLNSSEPMKSPILKSFQLLSFPRDRTERLNSYESNKIIVSKNTTLSKGQSDRQRLISDTPERSVSESSAKQFHWSPLTSCSDNEVMYKEWHLVRNHDHGDDNSENDVKLISEIYSTRLLATKGTLQKFVDDLFQTIFSTNYAEDTFPLAIKYMFDFLDDQALQHGILDPEVVHAWKNNSLPLRFWVNLIKNPNFLFDIDKSNVVDACLSVVAQAFMDSCSTSDGHLTKDSPSAKLLYAKDIPRYKELVYNYYSYIKTLPSVLDQNIKTMLSQHSSVVGSEFNTDVGLEKLHEYAVKFKEQLIKALKENKSFDKYILLHDFQRSTTPTLYC